MPDIGVPELLIIAVIVVLLFGPGKAADLGGALGKSIREFRHASKDAGDAPAPNVQASTEQPPALTMSSTEQRVNGSAAASAGSGSSARYCTECGSGIGEAQKFCSNCGTAVAVVG